MIPQLRLTSLQWLIVLHDLTATVAAIAATFFIRFEDEQLRIHLEGLETLLPPFVVASPIHVNFYRGNNMQPINIVESKTVVLSSSDIDTDQIIPARFLTTTTKEGLGKNAFADWRYDAQGNVKSDFILNQPAAKGCAILVAGRNFGCGSSREHAPWSLLDFGFRAVISSEIVAIFRSNSLKNGLLPVVVYAFTHQWLLDNPGAEVRIDLQNNTLTLPNGSCVKFPVEAFARYCLLNGVDELGYLLKQADVVTQFEQAHA